MNADYPIQHEVYTDATSANGYRGKGDYSDPVERLIFGPAPESSRVDESTDHTTRVVTKKTLYVPDAAQYQPRDRITLPGDTVPWFVTEDDKNWTDGPFGYKPGREVIVEQVRG